MFLLSKKISRLVFSCKDFLLQFGLELIFALFANYAKSKKIIRIHHMGYLLNTLVASSIAIASTSHLCATETGLTWTPEAIIQTKTISDVQISPDNESVLFVVTEPRMTKKKGTLLSRIYKKNCNSKGSPVPFSAPNVSSMQPRWSPDGQWIAFISTREGIKRLYLLSSEGGE